MPDCVYKILFHRLCEKYRPLLYDGLGDAIKYAESQIADSPEAREIWVTYDVNMPYIYALFYTQYPADEFISTVKYLNPGGAFRWVSSFGKSKPFSLVPRRRRIRCA